MAHIVTEISSRSKVVVTAVTVSLFFLTVMTFIPGVSGDHFWGNVPFSFASSALAVTAAALALRIPKGTHARTQGLLLAASVIAYALGDILWVYYETGLGQTAPYPGFPDIFYGPLLFVPLCYALLSAFVTMRRLDHSWRPVAVSAAVSTGAILLLLPTVLIPIATDAHVSVLERMVSVAYPVADILLLLGPAAALIGVLMDLGGTDLARPWGPILAAVLLMVGADAVYGYLNKSGSYVVGSALDMVWLVAFGLVVIGISRMVDVHTQHDTGVTE